MSALKLVQSPQNEVVDHLLDHQPRVFCFIYQQYYLSSDQQIELAAVLVSIKEAGLVKPFFLVTNQIENVCNWLISNEITYSSLKELSVVVESPVLGLGSPWLLEPVKIPKPWGQEIWFTGIEKRGQSKVTDGLYQVDLPWVLSIDGGLLGTGGTEPNLLKILDPLPEDVYGDLYFELHQQKQEVYVVTHVEHSAWPDGKGAIRFGFDQVKRDDFDSDMLFRQSFQQAVKDYQQIRNQVDLELDDFRLSAAIGINEPVDAIVLHGWIEKLPKSLRNTEKKLRNEMNSFTQLLPLEVGDVVKVPCLMPHALQHGVRTVEFQTPVYERKIVSFAQKVLTQPDWDTEDAVALMMLSAGKLEALPLREESQHCRLEQIVSFDDFEVFRLTLEQGKDWLLADNGQYRLCMTVRGRANISGIELGPEQAVLVPGYAQELAVTAIGSEPLVLLIASPC